MDPPELASEHAPCYARRGRIEPPGVEMLEHDLPADARGLWRPNVVTQHIGWPNKY
jgi:hypothetical protein